MIWLFIYLICLLVSFGFTYLVCCGILWLITLIIPAVTFTWWGGLIVFGILCLTSLIFER